MPDENLPIISHAGSSLAQTGAQGGRIIAEMVSGALTLSRDNATLPARFTIGDHVFCEPDYKQLLLWARALALEPVEIAKQLLSPRHEESIGGIPWQLLGSQPQPQPASVRTLPPLAMVSNGRFVKLHWDLDKLPLASFDWVDGLEIEELTISCHGSDDGPICTNDDEYLNPPPLSRVLSLPLPHLRRLHCGGMNRMRVVDGIVVLGLNLLRFSSIDLSNTPFLEYLDCSQNQISALDLSKVPNLKTLNCGWNQLTSLDLSFVRQLEELNCTHNHLKHIEISRCRHLHSLNCSANKIALLDLAGQARLRFIDCSSNQLKSLRLGSNLKLEQVKCADNCIEELDIRELVITEPVGDVWRGMEVTVEYDKETTRLIQRPDQNF